MKKQYNIFDSYKGTKVGWLTKNISKVKALISVGIATVGIGIGVKEFQKRQEAPSPSNTPKVEDTLFNPTESSNYQTPEPTDVRESEKPIESPVNDFDTKENDVLEFAGVNKHNDRQKKASTRKGTKKDSTSSFVVTKNPDISLMTPSATPRPSVSSQPIEAPVVSTTQEPIATPSVVPTTSSTFSPIVPPILTAPIVSEAPRSTIISFAQSKFSPIVLPILTPPIVSKTPEQSVTSTGASTVSSTPSVTPSPSVSPKPTETPVASETPEPTDTPTPHIHRFSEWKSLDDNNETRECDCGEKETRGHSYKEISSTIEATEATKHILTTEYKCNTCGHTKNTADVQDCNFISDETYQNKELEHLKCDANGCTNTKTQEHDLKVIKTSYIDSNDGEHHQKQEEFQCTRDDFKKTVTYDEQLTHNYTLDVEGAQKTYISNEDGTHKINIDKACECGHKQSLTIDEKTQCNYGNDDTCDECGYELPHVHDFSILKNTKYIVNENGTHDVIGTYACSKDNETEERTISSGVAHAYTELISETPIYSYAGNDDNGIYTHDIKNTYACVCSDKITKDVTTSGTCSFQEYGDQIYSPNGNGTHNINVKEKCESCGHEVTTTKETTSCNYGDDDRCDECGYEREHVHNYSNVKETKYVSNGDGTHQVIEVRSCYLDGETHEFVTTENCTTTKTDGSAYETYSCEHCGYTYNLEHVFGSAQYNEATGQVERHCTNSDCDYTLIVNDHEHSTVRDTDKTDTGHTITDTCTTCGYTNTITGVHDFTTEYSNKNKNTHTFTQECNDCGYKTTNTVAHNYKVTSDNIKTTYECHDCHYTYYGPHIHNSDTLKGTTYVSNNNGTHNIVETYSCSCGNGEMTQATKTENCTIKKTDGPAYETYSCEHCDYTYNLEHTFGNVQYNEATQQVERHCTNSDCDYTLIVNDHEHSIARDINKTETEHTIADTCTTCGYTSTVTSSHNFTTEYSNKNKDTHTVTQECNDCGYKTTNTVAHNYKVTSDNIKTTYECQDCHHTYYGPPLSSSSMESNTDSFNLEEALIEEITAPIDVYVETIDEGTVEVILDDTEDTSNTKDVLEAENLEETDTINELIETPYSEDLESLEENIELTTDSEALSSSKTLTLKPKYRYF